MNIDAMRAALAAAEDRGRLERQLRAARFKVSPDFRRRLELARFDYAGRRLVGDGCELVETAGRITARELSPC